jgi:hypothetical protein
MNLPIRSLLLVAVLLTCARPQAASAGTIVVGPEWGLLPVRVFPNGNQFHAYPFSDPVRVATGDVNNDGIIDIITGNGGGSGNQAFVRALSGEGVSEIRSFLPYGAFSGGVYVAAGDVNGDNAADIITGAGTGAPGGHVKVFNGQTGAEVRSFFAYDGFTGGVTVASGDVNGDNFADIITGAGAGAPGGHVKVFDGTTGALTLSFFAYGAGFSGGIFVASGDVNGDSYDDIVTGTDAGAAAHVKVFDGTNGSELRSFFAYGPSFTGGVRVAAGDVNGDGLADIITGAGSTVPHVKVFDAVSGGEIQSFFAYDVGTMTGLYVASIPEPGSVMLVISAALIGAVAIRRRLWRT